MEIETDQYRFGPHPVLPEWLVWHIKDQTRFNAFVGDLLVRRDGDRAVVRFQPRPEMANLGGALHGGALLGFIDCALFVGPLVLGNERSPRGLTIDLNTQFVGGADLVRPVDLILEVSRETGRLLFLRGTVEQGDDMVGTFMAIVRKAA